MRKKVMKNPDGHGKQSLCWYCQNALPYNGMGCSWSKYFEPVEGWTASESFFSDGSHYSWRVSKCPEYIADKSIKKCCATCRYKVKGSNSDECLICTTEKDMWELNLSMQEVTRRRGI